ncbi:hypothetical protein CTI14_53215, partial [Methylobacterium radiotolerans]
MAMAMGYTGAWNLDGSRPTANPCRPRNTSASSYYEIWLKALEKQVSPRGWRRRPRSRRRARLRAGGAGAGRAGLPRRVGAPRLRAGDGHGLHGRLEPRRQP